MNWWKLYCAVTVVSIPAGVLLAASGITEQPGTEWLGPAWAVLVLILGILSPRVRGAFLGLLGGIVAGTFRVMGAAGLMGLIGGVLVLTFVSSLVFLGLAIYLWITALLDLVRGDPAPF